MPEEKNVESNCVLDEDSKLNLKIDHVVYYGEVLSVRLFTAQVMRNFGILTSH